MIAGLLGMINLLDMGIDSVNVTVCTVIDGANRMKRKTSPYRSLYRRVSGERHQDGYPLCVYCGQPADSLDHVPPLSRVDDYRALGLVREMYLLVPACRDCNALAGSTLQATFPERVEYVKDEITRKNRRVIAAPEWDQDEIDELGGSLKAYIIAQERKRKRLTSLVEYYAGVDHILDHLDLDEVA